MAPSGQKLARKTPDAVLALQSGTDTSLTPSQIKAIGALLLAKTRTEAAREAGVSRSCLYKWLENDAEFIATYASLRQELRDAAFTAAVSLVPEALRALRQVLTRRSSPAGAKVRAAEMVFDLLASSTPSAAVNADEARADIEVRSLKRRYGAQLRMSDLEKGAKARAEAQGEASELDEFESDDEKKFDETDRLPAPDPVVEVQTFESAPPKPTRWVDPEPFSNTGAAQARRIAHGRPRISQRSRISTAKPTSARSAATTSK